MSVMRPAGASPATDEPERFGRPLRSKGLLPAIGVGAVVYFVTGVASLGTIGLIGIGAGVGYGVGSWIADKFQKKQESRAGQGVSMDQLPWAVQVALQQWQEFVTRRAAGRQLGQADIDQLWLEFEQIEPTHAANARPLVRGSAPSGSGASSSSAGPTPVMASGPGGAVIVPNYAAEV